MQLIESDSSDKQENSQRNPAYDGLYPIATLQEYIDGKYRSIRPKNVGPRWQYFSGKECWKSNRNLSWDQNTRILQTRDSWLWFQLGACQCSHQGFKILNIGQFHYRQRPLWSAKLKSCFKNGYQNSTDPAFVQVAFQIKDYRSLIGLKWPNHWSQHEFANPDKSFDFESLEQFREHSNLPLIFLFGTG